MEHKIIIDGIEYDTRNVSDLQYLESIGYLMTTTFAER